MNNDFAPFELAVKLKEKGYPQHQCDYAYITEDDEYEEHYVIGDREYIPFIPDYLPTIASPTISQVLKWLRVEKKIHLIVEISDSGWYYTLYPNVRWENGELKSDKYIMSFKHKASCEQAALAGIEYVLDNLI